MAHNFSALAYPNGKAYLFQGTDYSRFAFASGTIDQPPNSIFSSWSGLRPAAADAAIFWGGGKAYFFYSDEYVRYDVSADSVDPEYLPPNLPSKIAGNWPGLWTDGVDAAANWGNGKVFFFRDSEYLRYDITQDRADQGYPRPIAGNWNGVWTDGIDGVLYQGGQKAYFFKGNEFRRYDLTSDTVDDSGMVASLRLDPVPTGMCTAARDLTLEQANAVMGYLIETGALSLDPARTPYVGNWNIAITSPPPSAHVVVKPPQINLVDFINDAGPAPIIDNLDQRMLIALYRLTRWLNASEPTVNVLRHKGIGHGSGPPTDCHNQGRALDFSGVDGTSDGATFSRVVLRDWGQKPVVPGVAMRLDAAADPLAHDLFRAVHRFGTLECENNGIGLRNTWPPKNIGDLGGFVIHPDYVDGPPPGQQLRPQHQNHVHMQVGPT